MGQAEKKTFPIVRLQYKKGELIMKEGDYGISIYKVLKGHVRVTKEIGETEVTLATLAPGEVFGEMAFLNKLVETRSASVRAVDDAELEVWHPARLTREYEQMTPILKYILSQTLNRLVRLNKLFSQLSENKKSQDQQGPVREPGAAKRQYYRKDFNRPCVYRPIKATAKVKMQGQISDISVGGIGMDVSGKNAMHFPHKVGDIFLISTTLPNGQQLLMKGRIMTQQKDITPGMLHLGVKFIELDGESQKRLGFFMMS